MVSPELELHAFAICIGIRFCHNRHKAMIKAKSSNVNINRHILVNAFHHYPGHRQPTSLLSRNLLFGS